MGYDAGMLERIVKDGVRVYQSSLLREAGVRHGFSTRIGGVSKGFFASMNLGNPGGTGVADPQENIEGNLRRFSAAVGCATRRIQRVSQVHGAQVVSACGAEDVSKMQADALVSREPSCAVMVRVADCVPVLLASGDGKVVAAIHAGWRGVVAGVVGAALESMKVAPSSCIAAVGPCIGMEAFEVGAEVLEAFETLFGSSSPLHRRPDGKGHVDLRQAVKLQLLGGGVPVDRVDVSDRCTFRDAGEFFSHRREKGLTGRMAAIIGVREE